MPVESVRVVAVLPTSPERVYAAWLDAEEHGLMTGGGKATVEPRVGGAHTAWDDYIQGTIIELDPAGRIVQTWRTTEFPADHPDSRLEVHLRKVEGGTEVTLVHTGIPEGQGEQYEEGWRTHYLEPMARHFGKAASGKAPPAKKAVARKPAARKAAAKKPVAKKAAARKPAPKKAPARKAKSKKSQKKKARR